MIAKTVRECSTCKTRPMISPLAPCTCDGNYKMAQYVYEDQPAVISRGHGPQMANSQFAMASAPAMAPEKKKSLFSRKKKDSEPTIKSRGGGQQYTSPVSPKFSLAELSRIIDIPSMVKEKSPKKSQEPTVKSRGHGPQMANSQFAMASAPAMATEKKGPTVKSRGHGPQMANAAFARGSAPTMAPEKQGPTVKSRGHGPQMANSQFAMASAPTMAPEKKGPTVKSRGHGPQMANAQFAMASAPTMAPQKKSKLSCKKKPTVTSRGLDSALVQSRSADAEAYNYLPGPAVVNSMNGQQVQLDSIRSSSIIHFEGTGMTEISDHDENYIQPKLVGNGTSPVKKTQKGCCSKR